MKIITSVLITLFPILCFAQSDFKPGFIVKTSGDTIRGHIEQIEAKRLNDRISFAANPSPATSTFTTADIKSFGYDGENSFQKIIYINPFDSTKYERFAKTLSLGYYSLYTFWIKDEKYFIIKTPDNNYRLLADDERNSNGFLTQKGNFKNELLFISQSCEELREELERINYTEVNLIAYVTKLNKCVAPESNNSIVYKKEKSKLNIYAYAGGIALSKGNEYTGSIMGKLSVPAVDKNVSLNFGINYSIQHKSSIEDFGTYPYHAKQNLERSIISVPLTVQYYFTNGFIKPYVDAGLSFDHLTINGALKDARGHTSGERKFGLGFIAAIGIDGNITKNLFIRAEYRYELFLHHPTIGIAYTFK